MFSVMIMLASKFISSYLRNHCKLNRCFSTSYNDNLFKIFASHIGEKSVSISQSVKQQHSHDESYHRHLLPSVVVWPNNVKQVQTIAKLCSEHKIAMVPVGTSTGLEGGICALGETVSVNLTNMDKIRSVNLEDFDVSVEPGVTRKALNYELRNSGVWFPVDPGADASLCGMAATSASGTNAVRYGTMKQNVLNLEVVLPDGSILHTGGKNRRCIKSSAGYNLTELFLGSEGTLGFITAATLKLHARSETSVSGICCFPTIQDAVNAVIEIMQCAIPLARIELLDSMSINAANLYSRLNYKVAPTLFLEFHGTKDSTQEQISQAAEIFKSNLGSKLEWADKQEEINKLWQARHDLFYAIMALRPGSKGISTDVCVPITNLPKAIEYSQKILKDLGILSSILGHVGDGNFHCALAVNHNDPKEMDSVREAVYKIGKKAIELQGSCTGEHGIGIGKKALLIEEMNATGINAMKLIKNSFDPLNIMNPGKIL